MEKMSKDLFQMPEPRPAVRNGDAVVEFTHNGEVVGEFNFSKVIRSWWSALKNQRQEKALEVVR
jgi:hypothetical protein